MARANRYCIPGQIWHLTHRCHEKEFLLKFTRDRKRWLYWLYEAKKRYKLIVLNYVVTSNHIHLLVQDRGKGEIANSMQLIAGRTAQEYNQRKNRKGAFWEDRYHATAVESGDYFIKCLVYIDMNMVRAGVVSHLQQWPSHGYNEILNSPKRYSIININTLMNLCGIRDLILFHKNYKHWVKAELQSNTAKRENKWTESLAVGSREFIERYFQYLDQNKRKITSTDDSYEIREPNSTYRSHFLPKMSTRSGNNRLSWFRRLGSENNCY